MRKTTFALCFLLGALGAAAEIFSFGGVMYDSASPLPGTCIAVGIDHTFQSDEIPETGGESVMTVSISDAVRHNGALMTVWGIAPDAFSASEIRSIVIPSSVRTIGEKAFAGCRSLESVEMTYGVERIGEYCFQDCTSLREIEIPSSVGVLPAGLFRGCMSLRSVSLPSSISVIPEFFFCDCISLEDIEYNSTIRVVGQHAFSNCASLRSFDFYGVHTLGERAFSGCRSLDEIILKPGPAHVAQGAFEHCSGATLVVIGRDVTDIGAYAFEGCSAMRQVEFGKKVGCIGAEAFGGCQMLEEIYVINPAPPAIEYNTFSNINYEHSSLFVPKGGETRYAQSPYWMNFDNIIGVNNFPLSAEKVFSENEDIEFRCDRNGTLFLRAERELRAISITGRLLYIGTPLEGVTINICGEPRPILISDGLTTQKVF